MSDIVLTVEVLDLASAGLGLVTDAIGGLISAVTSVTGSFSDWFKDSLAAEQQQVQLSRMVDLSNKSIDQQNAAIKAVAGQTVSSTALSAGALAKLNDQYDIAKAKVDDMAAAYAKAKTHTETATLALANQKELVASLADKIAAGSTVITTSLVGAMGLIPPASKFSVDALNALTQKYKDLVGGSDDAVRAIELVGLKTGAISANQMPKFIQNVADLGAIMGDTSAAALILARAQEDPIAAMGKLQKTGILFDEGLKEQIKSMVKHGDAAGATALIMDRVAQATGGAAAANAGTLAGRWEILTNHLKDAGKGITDALIPGLEALLNKYIMPLVPVIEKLADNFASKLGPALQGVVTYLVQLGTQFAATFGQIQAAITPVVNYIIASMPGIQAALAGAWQWILTNKDAIIGAFVAIGAILAGAAILGAILAIGAVIAGLVTPLGLLIVAGALLGAAWATNWGGIRDILTNVWTGTIQPALQALWNWLQVVIPLALTWLSTQWTTVLLPAIAQVWNWIQGTLFPLFTQLVNWLQVAIPQALTWLSTQWTTVLLPAITQVWAWIQANLFPLFGQLTTWLRVNIPLDIQAAVTAFQTIYNWVITNWPVIFATIQTAINNIDKVVRTVLDALQKFWADNGANILVIINANWEAIKFVATVAGTALYLIIQAALALIQGFWKTWGDTIIKIGTDMYEALKGALQLFADIFRGKWGALGGDIFNIFKANMQAAADFFSTIAATIIGNIQGILNFIAQLVSAIRGVPALPGSGAGAGTAGAGGGQGGYGGSAPSTTNNYSMNIATSGTFNAPAQFAMLRGGV